MHQTNQLRNFQSIVDDMFVLKIKISKISIVFCFFFLFFFSVKINARF